MMGEPAENDQNPPSNAALAGQEKVPSSLPPPPRPSADPGTIPSIAPQQNEHIADHEADDVAFEQLTPLLALKLLCLAVEGLVNATGDIPPTPPITSPGTPNLNRISQEKPPPTSLKPVQDRPPTPRVAVISPLEHDEKDQHDADAIPPRARTPIGSPEAHPTEPTHLIDPISIAPERPISPTVQHSAIARKFYSKKPPPISFHEYLLRLHRYCPMSTAVYLATSIYIHRLALGLPHLQVPVTPRNAHRLLLAGLRVAMKALEDQSYPARRFSKVGGVSEAELKRLEIAFCFVSNFDLRITRDMLVEHVDQLRRGVLVPRARTSLKPQLPVVGNKRLMCLQSGQVSTSSAGLETPS